MRASRFIFAAVILAGAVTANRHFDGLVARAGVRGESTRRKFEEFPDVVGKWRVARAKMTARQLELLSVDDFLFADFIAGSGDRIKVYVGYYTNPDKATRHPPTICYPGGGYAKTYEANSTLSVAGLEGGLNANVAVFERSGLKEMVIYWYSMSGYTGADASWQKLARVRSILSGRAVAGASKIQMATDVETTREHALGKLEEFLAEFLPALEGFIPQGSVDGS